jgi:hypothetical protein
METTRQQASRKMGSDGFLFSGNRHESVPRAVFRLPSHITPLKHNAWQVIQLHFNNGVTAFPTYKELYPCFRRCLVPRNPRMKPSRVP